MATFGHEDDHLDDPLDGGQLTDLGTHGGERVQRTLAGALHGLLLGDLTADLAGEHQRAVPHRQLSRRVDVVAAAQGRDVRRHRLGHLRDAQPELLQTLLGSAHLVTPPGA